MKFSNIRKSMNDEKRKIKFPFENFKLQNYKISFIYCEPFDEIWRVDGMSEWRWMSCDGRKDDETVRNWSPLQNIQFSPVQRRYLIHSRKIELVSLCCFTVETFTEEIKTFLWIIRKRKRKNGEKRYRTQTSVVKTQPILKKT